MGYQEAYTEDPTVAVSEPADAGDEAGQPDPADPDEIITADSTSPEDA